MSDTTKKRISTVCCYCNRVHSSDGSWTAAAATGSRTSHGVCPECLEKDPRLQGTAANAAKTIRFRREDLKEPYSL